VYASLMRRRVVVYSATCSSRTYTSWIASAWCLRLIFATRRSELMKSADLVSPVQQKRTVTGNGRN